jgi:excisionase family DNA binding protein
MHPLLTPSQVAAVLGVKVSTVYQWTHERYIPFVKVGRLVRFNPVDIENWVQKCSNSGRSSHRVDITRLGL